MTVLFLGDFGIGLMAAEAALLEAVRAIGDPDPIAMTHTPSFTQRCVPGVTCIAPGAAPPRPPARVVLTGPIGLAARMVPLLAVLAANTKAGAAPQLHNLSLPPGLAGAGGIATVVAALAGIPGSFCDHASLLSLLREGLPWLPTLATYPERTLPHDESIAVLLPDGPAPIGMMFDGSPRLLACLQSHAAVFQARLAADPDRRVLAIPASARSPANASIGDAVLATRQALLAFRGGQAPLLPALLDTGWWLANATPGGLGGLVRRCVGLVTNTDFGVMLAAAAGIPCHVIGLTMDDPATRAGATLAGALAPGSSFVVLR